MRVVSCTSIKQLNVAKISIDLKRLNAFQVKIPTLFLVIIDELRPKCLWKFKIFSIAKNNFEEKR